jgi:hypothetical protein
METTTGDPCGDDGLAHVVRLVRGEARLRFKQKTTSTSDGVGTMEVAYLWQGYHEDSAELHHLV